MFRRSMMLVTSPYCALSHVGVGSDGRGESSLASTASLSGATTERDTCTNFQQSKALFTTLISD